MKNKNYLEDYTVIKVLGKGGFGVVSKVVSTKTGVFRAAKKINKAAMPPGEKEKLLAEM